MAKLQYRSLSNRVVDRLPVEGKDVIYWDRDLPGFGVRVYRSGARVYLVQGRGPGGSKRIAVGRHGVISADEARRRGAMLLTRIKAGEELEPRPGTAARPTVGELAERYLREHVAVRCKPNTARGYRRVIAECPSSKHSGRLSLLRNGGSGSSWIDVKPLCVDGSSGGFGLSVSLSFPSFR